MRNDTVMADQHVLHEIAKALRALQIRAIEAGSPKADALLAITTAAVRQMAIEAEREQPPLARTVEEIMQRLTAHSTRS